MVQGLRNRRAAERQSDHHSVDVSTRTCCSMDSLRLAAAIALRAIAHHCGGVDAPPIADTIDCTACTTATGFVPRHALQQRWAGRQLLPWYGDPPCDTGTASSTTPWHGCMLGRDGSIERPHIQHGSPRPSTRALTMRRRWPLAYLGLTPALDPMRYLHPMHGLYPCMDSRPLQRLHPCIRRRAGRLRAPRPLCFS